MWYLALNIRSEAVNTRYTFQPLGVSGICKPLLGNSFKPSPSLDRTSRPHIEFRTEGSILTFALSKI